MKKILLALVVFVVPLGFASVVSASAPGFLEGRLRILTSGGAQLADEAAPKSDATAYREYPLVILSKDGRSEVTRTVADEKGYYRVALSPGEYMLAVKTNARPRVHPKPRPFTIVAGQTVQLNLDIEAPLNVMSVP